MRLTASLQHVMFPKLNKRYVHSLKRVLVNNNTPRFAKALSPLCTFADLIDVSGTAGTGNGRMVPQRPSSGGRQLVIQHLRLGRSLF